MQDQEQSQVTDYSQLAPLKEEDTKILSQLYVPQEEEGLQRFDNALTKLPEYEDKIAQSPEILELTSLINSTNKKLVMKYRREHQYNVEIYEERLYKEVIYDLRPNQTADEEVNVLTNLKKANVPHRIRNMTEEHTTLIRKLDGHNISGDLYK
eukprot:403356530